MDKRVKKFRIPTLGAIVLLIAAISLTAYLSQRGTSIVGRATPDRNPRLVTVANISDDSFAVTFVTSDPAVAGVVLINESGEQVFTDSRGGARVSHYIEIDGLESEQNYSFVIESDGRRGEQVYQASTSPSLSTGSEQENVRGQVINGAGRGVSDSVVLLEYPNAQILAAPTDDEGGFVINLSNMRTEDLRGYVLLEDEDFLSLRVLSGKEESAVRTTYENRVLPEITLGRDYDFGESEEPDTSTPSGLFSLPESDFVAGDLSILNPSEGANLIDDQPLFSGTAPSETSLLLTFLRTGEEVSLVSDAFGRWTYRPLSPLAPGEETISVVGQNSSGVREQINRSFFVLSSGSQVTQSATPSATPTDTPVTSTPTPTFTPTPLPPTPTDTISTPTPTPLPVGGIEIPTPVAKTPTPTPFLTVTPEAPGDIGGVLLTFLSITFILTGATILFILA